MHSTSGGGVQSTSGAPILTGDNAIQAASTTYSAASGLYQVQANGLPILNSMDPATARGQIWLNFDQGGNWYGDTYGAYDTDGDRTTFWAGEQDDIYKAWHDAKTHFAMFDINVTTVMQTNTGHIATSRIIISEDVPGGLGQSSSFGISSNNTSGVVAGRFARTASAVISHETGHSLSLAHQAELNPDGTLALNPDGSLKDKYRPKDQWGRAAMMGKEKSGTFVHWTTGIHSGGAYQDDRLKIVNELTLEYNRHWRVAQFGTYTGDGYREDDHGNNRQTATHLPDGGGQDPYNVKTSGIIERLDDIDFFEFEWEGGDISIHIEAERALASHGQDALEYASSLRPIIRLISQTDNWIASRGPNSPIDVSEVINKSNLAADTYWVRVDSGGDYSDLGAYNITITNGLSGAFVTIPEPSSLALLGLGGLMLARRRRH